jgi:hypothetical protein
MVRIAIDGGGRVSINGHDVPNEGDLTPLEFAVEIVSSDFAEPLGRPVQALATDADEQALLVIDPDGRVTDVAPHPVATPEGVPPAVRTQGRHSDQVLEASAGAAPDGTRPRRRRYPVLIAGGAAVALAAGVLWTQRAPSADTSTPSGDPTRAVAGTTATAPDQVAEVDLPAQPVVESDVLRPRAVSGVVAQARPGSIRLRFTAVRRTPVTVAVVHVGQTDAVRRRVTLETGSQVVTISGLEAGRHRWRVEVAGQRPMTGVLAVSTDQEALPEEAPPPDAPATGTGTGDGDGDRNNDEGGRLVGTSEPPTAPVDPDGD